MTVASGFASEAGSASVAFLAETGSAKPTRAWTRFCEANPTECRVDTREAAVIRYDAKVLMDIADVNIRVNHSIHAVTDEAHWGVSDRWDYPTDGSGDCEDIQLEKRRQLVQRGYPARALRMAVVINREGEGHAVLVVRTDGGDYVLDNRVDAVLPWYESGYEWVKREGSDGPTWVALGEPTAAVETAGK